MGDKEGTIIESKKKLRVLIACEESQEVCKAFRARGHEAYSCDILPCSGGHPEWHLQMDALEALKLKQWDLIVMHPPCTAIAVSGNSTYGKGMIKEAERIKAVYWTIELWKQATSICDKVVMENPVGVLSTQAKGLPKPQYIHPYQFGHPEQKKTGLWIKGLPKLEQTNNVYDHMMTLPKKEREKNHYRSPGPERAKLRSKTYSGIAKAMAEQWSEDLG